MSYTDKPEECDCCQFLTDALTEYDAYARTAGHGPCTPEHEKARAWLCNVCASSYAGTCYSYPRNPGNYENMPMYAMIAHCTNMILQELRKKATP